MEKAEVDTLMAEDTKLTRKLKKRMAELLKDIADRGASSEVCGRSAKSLSALLAQMPGRDEALSPTHKQPLVIALVSRENCSGELSSQEGFS